MLHGIGLLILSIGLVVLSRFADRTARTEAILLAVILLIITALGAIPVNTAKKAVEVVEPMGLILSRQGEILKLPPFRRPHVDPDGVRNAARDYALCHESDPFAYGRMKVHLANGLELVSDIASDARACLRVKELRRRARANAA